MFLFLHRHFFSLLRIPSQFFPTFTSLTFSTTLSMADYQMLDDVDADDIPHAFLCCVCLSVLFLSFLWHSFWESNNVLNDLRLLATRCFILNVFFCDYFGVKLRILSFRIFFFSLIVMVVDVWIFLCACLVLFWCSVDEVRNLNNQLFLMAPLPRNFRANDSCLGLSSICDVPIRRGKAFRKAIHIKRCFCLKSQFGKPCVLM